MSDLSPAKPPGSLLPLDQGSASGVRFESILFPGAVDPAARETRGAPPFFRDLNLDQVVAAITAGWQEYDLGLFFQAPLDHVEAVMYRHEIMRDLERPVVMKAVRAFAETMRSMRGCLDRAQKSYYKHEQERWFLGAVATYTEGIERLQTDFGSLQLSSRGLRAFREYLDAYASSSAFTSLAAESRTLVADLSAIRYTVLMQGRTVSVRRYEDEPDYAGEVARTFERFRRKPVKNYLIRFAPSSGVNRIEARILEGVAILHPEVFQRLETFRAERQDYQDGTIVRFDREIHFYVAFLAYLEPFTRAGLSFCYPAVSQATKEVHVRDGFDLALAARMLEQRRPVVLNDFFLRGPERIFVVSGPNQGGKTTFARMFGQLHYLASLGCQVPAADARLFLFDRLQTHFEREEAIETARGKLQDDLVRLRHMLDAASSNTVLILNEVFSSTTVTDALYLSHRVMERLHRTDCLCVWVTFLTALAAPDRRIVSLVSGVDPDDPAIRTYKLERRAPDGLAYALAMAEKYRVTERRVRERIGV